MSLLEDLNAHLHRLLWGPDSQPNNPAARVLLRVARLLDVLVRDLTRGYLTLQAMSLVYTTLLSLVPLLAVSFSVLKGFGVHNQIEPALLNFLAPLGSEAGEITRRVIGFVDNMKVGVLGSLGLGLLIYTIISMVQKIEEALNYTWHVQQSRSFFQRFGRYISVILVGPVLVFSALGVSASVMSTTLMQDILGVEPIGQVVSGAARLVPFLLIMAAFAFVYLFVPNARVRPGPALVGAVVAGILWQSAGWAFAHFVATSTHYTAIYSGFAILVLFMIWVYVAWLILLVGASIAFYQQHPEYLVAGGTDAPMSNRTTEELALRIARQIANGHLQGLEPWDLDSLATTLAVPARTLEQFLSLLVKGGFLARTDQDPTRYLLARAPERISILSLLAYVRQLGEPQTEGASANAGNSVTRIFAELDKALNRALGGLTLRDLVEWGSETPPKDSQAPQTDSPSGVHLLADDSA